MYPYEDSQLEDIYALRAIIEVMVNDSYLWINADGQGGYILNKIKIKLLLSEYSLPNTIDPLGKMVDFAFDDGRHSGRIYPLEEIKREYFWCRLESAKYLIRPRKGVEEHIYEVTDKTIGEVAKYVRQNVLVRNVKIF